MRSRKVQQTLGFLGCATLIGVLAGCGGGSSTPVVSNGKTLQENLDAGRTAMNDILQGNKPANTQTLNDVFTSFDVAHKQDAHNRQAEFGYAVSLVALRAQAVLDKAQGRAAGDDTNALSETANKALLWNTTPGGTDPAQAVRLGLAAPLAAAQLSRAADPALLRATLSNLQTSLGDAITVLTDVAGQADFTYSILLKQGNTVKTITVDQGVVQSFLAGLYVVRAVVNLALAYDFNWGNV